MSSARWLVLLLAVLCVARESYAESDADLEKAKALFEDARKLMADEKYDSACSLLEQSLTLARGIGTRFNLADCEEHRGRYLLAQQLFLEVAAQAREAGQEEREKVARVRAGRIDEKLSRLKIETEAPALTIEVDGRTLSEQELGAPLAVEPGKHRLMVSAAGESRWSKDIDVPTAGLFIIVNVPPLTAATTRTEPEVGAVRASTDRVETESPEPGPELRAPVVPRTEDGRAARRAALIVAGVGVGAALAGVGFGLQYIASNHDAKAVCPTSYGCSRDEVSQHQKFVEDAQRARTWSYVGFGVGAAALTGAAVLHFTSSSARVSASTGVNLDGSWNVSVRGGF